MNGEEVKQTDSNFDAVSKAQTEGTNALFSASQSPLKNEKGYGKDDELVSARGGGGAASALTGNATGTAAGGGDKQQQNENFIKMMVEKDKELEEMRKKQKALEEQLKKAKKVGVAG